MSAAVKSRRDVDFSVRDTFVDLEVGNEPSIDEYEEKPAAALDAQCVEHDASVFVELDQRTISSILGRIGRKRDDILLRNPRHLFDGNIFSRNLGAHRCCEYFGIPGIRLCVHPERAMSSVSPGLRPARKAGKTRIHREFSCRLIKGLTGILQLRKLSSLFKPAHEAPHHFASFDAFYGREHLWPGYHANSHSGTETRAG